MTKHNWPPGVTLADNAVDECYQRGVASATTPGEIKLFQLIAAKHAILLEAKGLRHSRFRCGVRGLWAKHYGMPPRSKALVVAARIQEDIERLSFEINQLSLPLEEPK